MIDGRVCFNLEHYGIYSRLEIAAVPSFHRDVKKSQRTHCHLPCGYKLCVCVQAFYVKRSLLYSRFVCVLVVYLSMGQVCILQQSVQTNTCCCSTPVSSALGDVDQFLDAPCVSQGLGVLHVFAGDLVQSATDGCHSLI